MHNDAAKLAGEACGLTVYTDGSSKGNPGRGGWGFAVFDVAGAVVHEHFGGQRMATNNQMELQAMAQALTWLKGRPAVVYTDSKYVEQGLTSWLAGWKRRGWKSAAGEPVKNQELWMTLDSLNARSRAQVRWVRGHNGTVGNELADRLANLGAAAA